MHKQKILSICAALCIGLWLPAARAEVTFGALRFNTDAAYIDLQNEEVSDWAAFFAFLDSFPNLEKVDMFATGVHRKEIAQLAQRYPNVEFGWTMQFAEHTVRTDATAFSTLHYSGSKTHTNEDFSILKYCKNLRALDIGHNSVNDLSFLYGLPELRVLIIACNRITDIAPLAGLTHLEYLEMFSNYVEDLSPLVNLPYLAHLNIGYNNIRDLSPLYQMPQLKRLWIKKCHGRPKVAPLSEETVASLQAALGDCEIDATHNPSEGGWRDETHFEVFHEYFRTGEYRPFPDSPKENR